MLNESAALPGFLSFVEKRKVSYITTRLALDWAQRGREGQSKWRFSMVRGLAKYAAIFDNRNEVPQLGLLRTKYPRPRPYIYSDDEIERLLCAARNWGHDRPPADVLTASLVFSRYLGCVLAKPFACSLMTLILENGT